jgi:glycosyltransferase involved in cell wall biosynthesis
MRAGATGLQSISFVKVTVIIPTRDRGALLSVAIANLLNQTVVPHEIIVVDDGSTDDTAKRVRAFGDRVSFLRQGHRGPGAARNAGLKLATGDFIQFQDSDDLFSRNKLEVQAQALDQRGAQMAYGPWAPVLIEGADLAFADHVLQTCPLPNGSPMVEWFAGGWSLVLQACLFRRCFVEKIGTFREDLKIWEDGEYLVRAFLGQPVVLFTPECLTLYRINSNAKLTASGTSEREKLRDRSVALPAVADLLARRGMWFSASGRWRHAFQMRNLWCEMTAAGGFSNADRDRVAAHCRAMPLWLFRLWAVSRRVLLHLRWRITGSRWTRPHRSRYPSSREWLLVEDLGFRHQRRRSP